MSYFTWSCCGEELPAQTFLNVRSFLATYGWQNQDVCVYCLDELEGEVARILSDPISPDELPF